MILVLDTNIFLRVAVRENEAQYQESLALFQQIKQYRVHTFVPLLVLTEIEWTLRSYYQYPKQLILERLQGILALDSISIVNNSDHTKALKLFSRHNVKFIDCLIASIPQAQNKKWKIVSYDRDFDKLGVTRIEPKEALKLLA